VLLTPSVSLVASFLSSSSSSAGATLVAWVLSRTEPPANHAIADTLVMIVSAAPGGAFVIRCGAELGEVGPCSVLAQGSCDVMCDYETGSTGHGDSRASGCALSRIVYRSSYG